MRDARAERLALESAIVEHERANTNPPSNPPWMPAAGRGGGRRGGRRNRSGRHLVSSGMGGMNPLNRSDLSLKPPSVRNVPQSVPRQVAALISWDTVKFDAVITATTGGVTEANFTFRFNQHPQQASWAALFDQFCIPMATVEFDSAVPNGSTAIPVRLYTAIDFDSSANLGSVAAIEDYTSCEVTPIVAGFRHKRSCRPCVKIPVGGVSGLSTAGPTQQWIDCGDTDAIHYGIRSLVPASASAVVNTTTTIWFAFRNQI